MRCAYQDRRLINKTISLQKKKEKKRNKDKRRSRSFSPTPLAPEDPQQAPLGHQQVSSGSATPKEGDDMALSESELESQRAALLAQLGNESADD